MPLDLFKYSYVRHLRANVGQNLARYGERKPWADKPVAGEPVRLSCQLTPAESLDLELPVGSDLKDLENTKIVHQAFPDLTPLQARDPRLWTRLAHVECWDYMRKRWDVDRYADEENPGKSARFVLARYFVPRAESRALLRNGLARLWWYAHLTHDSDRDDPYELTAVLLSSLDIAQQLLERNMGRAPYVRAGFLDYIRTNGMNLGTSAGQRRNRIRDLAKLLNLRGGVTLLDCLSKDEVTTMLDAELRLGLSF